MKQRDQVKMTPEEIDAFFHGVHTMSCATIGPDGAIHLVAMWYGFLEGSPAVTTKAKSQKVTNLRRNPRITCLIEEGGLCYEELRGVEIVGRAEIVEDADRLFELGVSALARNRGVQYTPERRADVELILRNRVGIKILAEKYVSWDHRKLAIPREAVT